MKWVFAGWAVMILVVGVLVTALTAGQPTKEEEAAAQAKEAEEAKKPPAELTATDTIVRRIEEIRGLRFAGATPEVEVVPATQVEQALTKLDSTAQQEETPEDKKLTAATGILLAQAGAVEPDAVQQVTQQNATPGARSAFVPEERKVLVDKELAESDPQNAELLIAYELARGLEAEGFEEVGRHPRPFRDDEAARIALQEGAAALAAEQYAAEHFGASEPVEPNVADLQERGEDPATPPALKELATFPTRAGRDFVEGIHEDGGWPAVDRAHEEPPVTTREVLHPDADEEDAPPAPTIEIEDILGEGWQELASADVGELDTITMLASGAGENAAREAADGWRTGRFQTFGKGAQAQQCKPPCRKESVSIVVLRWADPSESEDFEGAIRVALESGADAEKESEEGTWTIDNGGAALVRAGRFTSLVFAPDARLAGRIAETSLEG